jgi:uncharacterized RDD family membrane protein YckC
MLRCIRCGSPIDGLAQYCGDCAASADMGIGSGAAVATATTCPRCGRALTHEGAACPFCSAGVEAQYAGFWMRFAAYIVDGIILGVAGFLVRLTVSAVGAAFLIQMAIGAGYTIGFWSVEGATPGKMVMGMRVVKANGEPLDLGTAFVRYLGYFVSAITLGIGFLLIAFTSEKRGLHDYIAGTMVVHGGRSILDAS